MKLFNVGILGCANIAVRYLAPSFQDHPEFRLIGFAGRDLIKTTEISKIFNCEGIQSYDKMIERSDIDLIYIPLPNSLHYEWVIKALKSGKHVLCEKSLGCSYYEVEEMVIEARKNNRLLIENFQFRFHSQHQFVKKLLSDGEIGFIRNFRASFGFPPFSDQDNIRYKKDLGGGALLDAGAYTIKATQFIMGNGFHVDAAIQHIDKKMNIDIYGGLFMKNSKGQLAELSYGFDNYYQCNYEIWGSKGKITATRAYTAGPGFSPTIIFEKQDIYKTINLPSDNHFYNLLTHIANCINLNDYEDEYLQNLQQASNIEEAKNISVKYLY
ncbi:MAG: Glucose--fructose oxidoreductase precursor [Bacteroidota bacterium]